MRKTTLREIRQSLGRYIAILAIIVLGVGFFAGLKITKPAMTKAADEYFRELQLFDYRLISTVGFEEEDVEAFGAAEGVRAAEGSISTDILYVDPQQNEGVLKVHLLPEEINGIKLTAGRMPEKGSECVADSKLYTEQQIGSKIRLSEENEEEDRELFAYEEYTIVGLVQSSYYTNFERGNTALGNGRVNGFMYIPREGFLCDYYTEIFVKFDSDLPSYSEEYDSFMSEKEDTWDELCKLQTARRFSRIVGDAQKKIDEAREQLEEEKTDAQEKLDEAKQTLSDAQEELAQKQLELDYAGEELTERLAEYESEKETFEEKIREAEEELSDAQEELDGMKEPEYYVLKRNTNIGYACFENDSAIIDELGNVFPVFFFLVAALVCMTTMNRMIEEQRTQIGVLKALGYGNGVIMSKYLFYAGSAAATGCILGFFGGTWLFPKVIWMAYGIMYTMGEIAYVFDGKLALIALLAAMLCSMGATWFTCKNELLEVAASLMRPRAPRAGKRVFLEYFPFLWKRMKFLHKVSVRNIFRYKKRFFMMVIGISGCTALLVTGFGVEDSVAEVADMQFDRIQIYDMGVTFREEAPEGEQFQEKADEIASEYAYFCEKSVDMEFGEAVKSINLVVPMEQDVEAFLQFYTTGGEKVHMPQKGECIISHSLAQTYGIDVGDSLILRDEDMRNMQVSVSGIFENFIYNYIYVSAETYQEEMGEAAEFKTAYLNLKQEQDLHQASAELMKLEEVSAVTLNEDTRVRMANMMSSLDYVVLLIIVCAAFLAFIVLYNLTNINITERIREIATLKVLGFYKKESASYVFRENMILTLIGTGIGLLLGKALHAFVMNQIHLDMIAFDICISTEGYLYSVLLTLAFACVVNLFMSGKLEKINMAESLKSVD